MTRRRLIPVAAAFAALVAPLTALAQVPMTMHWTVFVPTGNDFPGTLNRIKAYN